MRQLPVRAIRGAITVNENNAEQILDATKTLLSEIVERNGLDSEDVISVIFSVTKDLDAVYPAVAARQMGWTDTPLFCLNEMNVPGSLPRCIRVLMHVDTEKSKKEIVHVYLGGASVLRPDLAERKITIAIDGPAGSGKSTVAKIISKKLGIIYLDTGAMYRTVALKAIREGIDTTDAGKLAELVSNIDIKIRYENQKQLIFLDGEEISSLIRTPEVSIGASNVAVVPEVRLKMVELQREIARDNSVVMDGRDIGTYVLPDATVKIYLSASVEERALRRYREQCASGVSGITLEQVKRDIEYRDKNDSGRAFAPLAKAEDAVEIDTTGLTIDEVVNRVLEIVKEKTEDD